MSWADRDAPDPAEGGPGVRVRCEACAWCGQDGYDHHRQTGHRIVLPNGIVAVFVCCAEHSHHIERRA